MGVILQTAIEDVRLESILQLAEGEMFTGWIAVGDDAELDFFQGRLVRAAAGRSTGPSALYALFFRDQGKVVMSRGETPDGADVGPLTELMMEGLRLVDEWARLAPMIVAPVEGSAFAGPLEKLAPLLDGKRTLAEAVLFSGLSPERAVDPLLSAFQRRALKPVAAPDAERAKAARTPPKPEEYFELMDRGRLLLKEGRLPEAELAFRQALMARPEDRLAAQNLRRVSQLRVSGGA